MELDDMKLAWAALDRRLERQHALELAAFRDCRFARARRHLWPTRAGVVARMAGGAVLLAIAAAYWLPRWGVAHLVAWGWMLQAYGLLLVVTGGLEAQRLAGIDCAGHVVDQQRRVTALRAWRIRLVPLWTVTGALVWIPALLAAFDALLGVDVFLRAPEVVVAFFASAAGVVLGAAALRRAWPAAARHVDASAVGGGLERMRAELDEIERFERE